MSGKHKDARARDSRTYARARAPASAGSELSLDLKSRGEKKVHRPALLAAVNPASWVFDPVLPSMCTCVWISLEIRVLQYVDIWLSGFVGGKKAINEN